jgi:hypothetical protein
MSSDKGYIYCMTNDSYDGIVKVGFTTKSPLERATELYSTGVLSPFKVAFAKKVLHPKNKEKMLHSLISKYHERPNSNREFFKITPNEVECFFNLIDGEIWEKNDNTNIISNNNQESEYEKRLRKNFVNGQRILHEINSLNKKRIGIYNSSINRIVYADIYYKSLSEFANEHLEENNMNTSKNGVSGWRVCKYEINGKWVSTKNLK